MRKILLHRPTADNAGLFADAGTTLSVGEKLGADGASTITAARAAELVDSGGAVDPDTADIDPSASAFEVAAQPLGQVAE